MRIAETQLVRAIHELAATKAAHVPELSQAVKRFLSRHRLTKRTGKLLRLLEAYEEDVAQTVTVQAKVAHQTSPALQQVIKQKAEVLFGTGEKKTNVTFHTDPTLLGGVRLETRDSAYDFSLKRSLKEIRKSFAK